MSARWQPGDVITMRYTGHFDGTVRDRPGILQGWPHVVVEDSERVLALWHPAGTRTQLVDLADRQRNIPLTVWRREVLRLFLPRCAYSVWLWWTAEPDPAWPDGPAVPRKNNEIRSAAEIARALWRSSRERTAEQLAASEADQLFHANWRQESAGTTPFSRTFLGWYVNLEAPFVRTSIGIDTSDNSLDVVVAPDLIWRWKDEDTMDFWVDAGVFTRDHVEQFYRDGREAIALVEGRQFPFDGSYLDWLPDPAWPVPTLPEGWAAVPGYDWSHAIGRRLPNVDHP